MSKRKALPRLEYLQECFEADFEKGILYWKDRPLSHFINQNNQNQWNSKWSGRKAGFLGKSDNRWQVRINNTAYQQNRILYLLHNKIIDEHLVIDHIDRNCSNNSISNLRQITHSLNNRNTKGRAQSGHKGIHKSKKDGKYMPMLVSTGKCISTKSFQTLEEALIYRDHLIYENDLGFENYR